MLLVAVVHAQEPKNSEINSGDTATEGGTAVDVADKEVIINKEKREEDQNLEINSGDTAAEGGEATVDEEVVTTKEKSEEEEEVALVRASIQRGVPSFYSDGNITYARSNTRIRLSAAERVSSVSKIEYKIDQSEYRLYSEPITISEEGQHQIAYRSLDLVGNMEFENVVTVIIDDTPPSTFLSSNVSFIKVKGSLFVPGPKNPQLYIKATDHYSGVKAIQYYIKNGETQEFGTYSAAVPLDSPGEKTVIYRAIDNLGNVSEAREITIITDATPPTVRISFGKTLKESGDKKYSPKNNKLILKATDEGSGVSSIYVKLSNEEGFQPYAEPITITGDGKYDIEAKSVDRAGNESLIAKESIIVDAEPPQTNLEFLSDGSATTSDQKTETKATEAETETDQEDPVGYTGDDQEQQSDVTTPE